MNLLNYKKNVFSQNGEDGVIEKIFELIGSGEKFFCEFGAWDGIHLSNCRQLVLQGWSGLYIEGDSERYKTLVSNYRNNPKIKCVNKFVDIERNNLNSICKEYGFDNLDLLSIDIDGLDYEIFKNLNFSPRVICIEINAGHSPDRGKFISNDISASNVGQPFSVFMETAKKLNYELVCYTGNAFFIRNDLLRDSGLTSKTATQAYKEFLEHLSKEEKKWLYLVGRGYVEPFYNYNNKFLVDESIGMSKFQKVSALLYAFSRNKLKFVRDLVK